MRMLLLIMACAAKILPGLQGALPITPYSCLWAIWGTSSTLGMQRAKGSLAFWKFAVGGPIETHGFAVGTSDKWILPMQEGLLVCVCPLVCCEEPWSCSGQFCCLRNLSGDCFFSYLLLPSESIVKWAWSHFLSTKESVTSSDTNGLF